MLIAEQKSSFKMLKYPIDTETTSIGSTIIAIREVISGKGHSGLQPYNYVSYRVIARLADLLQEKDPVYSSYDKFTAGQSVIDQIFEH
jgi:hypothetical protein